MSIANEIGDAIASHLTAEIGIQVLRVYTVSYDLRDAETTRVVVICRGVDHVPLDRETVDSLYRYDIVCQGAGSGQSSAVADSVIDLCEQIVELLIMKRLPTRDSAICDSVSQDMLYSDTRYDTMSHITSAIEVIYKESRVVRP